MFSLFLVRCDSGLKSSSFAYSNPFLQIVFSSKRKLSIIKCFFIINSPTYTAAKLKNNIIPYAMNKSKTPY